MACPSSQSKVGFSDQNVVYSPAGHGSILNARTPEAERLVDLQGQPGLQSRFRTSRVTQRNPDGGKGGYTQQGKETVSHTDDPEHRTVTGENHQRDGSGIGVTNEFTLK